MNMQAARALVTKAELESLLAAPDSAVRAEPEFAEAGPPDADADRRMFEQAFQYWERTVRDLRSEVRELRERVERMEREWEVPQAARPAAPEPATAGAPEAPRLSRVERYRKSRWF